MILKENAVLIADVHYDIKYRRDDFENLVLKLEKNPPPQLILLGDIFDLLFGGVKYTENQNSEMIKKIDNLGKKTEIIYFEGNHDFNLKNLFSNIQIIQISKQPIKMRFRDLNILISHGDYSVQGFFHFYRRSIEKSTILNSLNFLDSKIGNRIIRKLEANQRKKRKCYKIEKFKDIIKTKLEDVDSNLFIDGHYHQGSRFTINNIGYINLFSFACNQTCFIVKSKHNSIFFENIRLKDF